MPQVVNFKSIDFKNILYGKPKKISSKYYIPLCYEDKGVKMTIQSSKMKCVKGLEQENFPSHLEFDLDNENLYEFITNFEEENINNVYKKTPDWFNKKLPKDAIENMFRSSIRPGKKKNTYTLRVKLPSYKDMSQLPIDIYTNMKEKINYSDIKKESYISTILEAPYLVFSSQLCYITWEIVQLKVYVPKIKISGANAFLESSDSEYEEEYFSD